MNAKVIDFDYYKNKRFVKIKPKSDEYARWAMLFERLTNQRINESNLRFKSLIRDITE